MSDTVYIDGSYGEGGGQIIRTALALAAITGRAVEIGNIRAGREKPGLQPQHLAAVRVAAAVCDAEVAGAATQSMHLHFRPRTQPLADAYTLDIGTAGAIPLVLQTALLPLSLADGPSSLHVIGGTHVPFAPVIEYVESVYLPLLQRAGVTARCQSGRAGYRQRGGGEVTMAVTPASALHPLTLTERGKLLGVKATIITSELPEHVGERGAAAVERALHGIGRRIAIEQHPLPSLAPGAAILVTVECEHTRAGFSALGERGKPMERVAEEAAHAFLRWWKTGAACDEHLADQLVLPLALAPGESRWTTPTATEHLRTVIWTVQQFLDVKAEMTERADGGWMVVMEGAGIMG